ncbi:CopD family protein [Fluviibacter phosphoraccumulans]|jgi:putative membrane protein|uniref:CopD family protein n=1 Tax=Fluviibacter phosphoraccumulans TaxID=1751046 RepID=UPI0024E26B71|nr:CopD family protein [Fluviibacter phosphoraccumulans]
MLTIKAFHIILVVSWFAGLFYLPRIYVNLAAITDTQSAEYQRLLGMSRRLYRFVTPIGLGAVILGLWLWFGYGFAGGWLHAKTLLVVFLLGYHFYCGRLYRQFAAGQNTHSHVWYRWFNEIPVLMLTVITLLVVLKPF